MKRSKTNKGITLVALIITIIVLLILAVVSIRAVQGDGIIQHAKNAKTEYQAAQVNESETLDSYLAKLDTNADFLATIQIGDKVAYNEGYSATKKSTVDSAFTMDDLEWRVLDVEADGTVELISTKPTTSTLKLSGQDGWLNAEENLDKLCSELYANGTGVTARSLKVEDVDKLAGVLTDADKQACDSSYGSIWQYQYSADAGYMQYRKSTDNGSTWDPGWTNITNSNYQTFTEPGKETISKDNYQNADGTQKINQQKYTYYKYTISSKVTSTTSDGISMASLISQGLNDTNDAASGSNVTQWLSSRCVGSISSKFARFYVRRVSSGYVSYDYLWESYGNYCSPAYAVRPVVSLPSSVLGEKVDGVWQVNI